jgi:hypothetical protein
MQLSFDFVFPLSFAQFRIFMCFFVCNYVVRFVLYPL